MRSVRMLISRLGRSLAIGHTAVSVSTKGSRNQVPERPPQEPPATDLTARERILLFCVASGTDRRPAGAMGEVVTGIIVIGLVVRDAQRRLSLTPPRPPVLKAILPRVTCTQDPP